MTTYNITDIRAVFPTAKVAEKNPDRFITVYGTFFDEKNHQLSFTSKAISFDDAKHPDFNLDLEAGTLTIHNGEKGRKKVASISQDEINKKLNALRK